MAWKYHKLEAFLSRRGLDVDQAFQGKSGKYYDKVKWFEHTLP